MAQTKALAIAVQRLIKITLLEIAPDLRGDRLGSCSGNRVIESAQAVDEVILPLQTNPHLQGTVVIPQGWRFPQDSAL